VTNQLMQQYPNNNFNVQYFDSWNNAHANQNHLPLNYQANSTQTIYVRVTNSQFQDCFSIITFDIVVHPYPEITDIDDVYGICNGETLILKITENFDSYQWSDESTGSTFVVSQSGNYSVTVTKNGCSVSKSFSVIESFGPIISDIIISDFTISQNTIEVLVQNSGDFEYSIN